MIFASKYSSKLGDVRNLQNYTVALLLPFTTFQPVDIKQCNLVEVETKVSALFFLNSDGRSSLLGAKLIFCPWEFLLCEICVSIKIQNMLFSSFPLTSECHLCNAWLKSSC